MSLAIVEVPTALGLSPAPGTGGSPRGTWRAPDVLAGTGLFERMGARVAARIEVAAYDPAPEAIGGARNTAAVVRQTSDIASAVSSVLEAGDRPLVLGGDCSVLLGPMLALRRMGRYGLVFVDGHLDFRHLGNSQRLSAVAGEDLAIVTGRGLEALAAIDDLRPYVRDTDVVALAERERDLQTADVYASGIEVIGLDALRRQGVVACATAAADRLRDSGCQGFWIHLDLDVLDSAVLPAVDSPQPDGLVPDQLVALLATLSAHPAAIGLDVTIYDPELDGDGSGAKLVSNLLVDALA